MVDIIKVFVIKLGNIDRLSGIHAFAELRIVQIQCVSAKIIVVRIFQFGIQSRIFLLTIIIQFKESAFS